MFFIRFVVGAMTFLFDVEDDEREPGRQQVKVAERKQGAWSWSERVDVCGRL